MRWGGFGARYAAALAVDAIGAGLLRPFLVVYGVGVLALPAAATGIALTAGLLAGLVVVPPVGRWIDRGARVGPVVAALVVRVAGVAVLLGARGLGAFAVAAVLLGVGNQAWPPAHAALVSAMAGGRADGALAFGRALRNGGLGVGALVATVAVGAGTGVLRLLAVGTMVGYAVAAGLVGTMRVTAATSVRRKGKGRSHRVLVWGNLPLALCYSVLEVVLPVVLTQRLHAPAVWAGLIFAGNTVLVVVLQVPLVVRLAGRSRRGLLAVAGGVLAVSYAGFWVSGSAGAVAGVAVVYTVGELLYAGFGTALVAAAAPSGEVGRALAGFQLSTGVANALAPALLLGLLQAGEAPLWSGLVVATALGGWVIGRWGPVPPERAELSGAEPVVAARAGGSGSGAP
ncbi:MFS transporter [Dactylosporangium sp. NPDC049140]|uniref:MFS transporter n=1 Tax=Dactylosporangium sp. NPDC049140 TaxID=3155647 RepID=UPI0033DF5EC9